MPQFIPFFFDGNSWFGIVNSEGKWFELLEKYPNHNAVLSAKMAPMEEIGQLPTHYHFGAIEVRTGDMPSFGFRREHMPGTVTLEDWALERGMDLRGLSQKKVAKKKRRWWLLWLW